MWLLGERSMPQWSQMLVCSWPVRYILNAHGKLIISICFLNLMHYLFVVLPKFLNKPLS